MGGWNDRAEQLEDVVVIMLSARAQTPFTQTTTPLQVQGTPATPAASSAGGLHL